MKKSIVIFGLIVGLSAVTACSKQSKVSGKIELFDFTKSTSYYRSLRLNGGYKAEQFSRVKTDTGTYFAITDVKTVVVPVDFTDYLGSDTLKGEEGYKADLEAAILGDGSGTSWESLKSFYYKSSHGQCNIDGVVTDFYHTGMTAAQFAKYGSGSTYATQKLASDIADWLVDDLGMDLTQYDANKDGAIDSLIMIYTAPYHVKNIDNDLYWAFCWSNSGAKLNDYRPDAYRFFWASYQFFYEAGYYDDAGEHQEWTDEDISSGRALPDSHTLIHEFGHVLSLPDYYCQANTENNYDPLMKLDMMAYNIGDHNSWSKAVYGWHAPYVVSGNGTLTLNSTTDTGEFAIIPIQGKFNNTMLDQFLMLEFMTPTGVCTKDATEPLYSQGSRYPRWYTEAGVRAILVDARPGIFTYNSATSSYTFAGFTSSVNPPENGYVSLANDNNDPSRSSFTTYKLLELVSATGTTAKYLNREAKDVDLFKQGDKFGIKGGVWEDFQCDGKNGERNTSLGLGFEIKKMTDSSVTIKFSTL